MGRAIGQNSKTTKTTRPKPRRFGVGFDCGRDGPADEGFGAERLKSETVAVLSIFIYHTARRGFGYIEIVERKMIRQPCDARHLPRYAASQTARFTVVITRATTVLVVYVSIEYPSRNGVVNLGVIDNDNDLARKIRRKI